ncbi:short-chain dehydrogenase/reductase SDR [Cristinia sonorae]|uniref:Short-chain dehydrogenase/reductase SDR n=1 Tax=Cristinia sonorae TaxID=1940300 RepID=A0A8K0UTQ4_9AGAR|nr:short-chain dehydrogenase/reductase SDR [Cristinia sonorae]
MSATRPTIVIAGVGNGSGTGAATARVFAKAGYRVALIARGADQLKKIVDEITQAGGEAEAFPISSYSYADVTAVFTLIKSHTWPSAPHTSPIRVALFNAVSVVFKSFFDVTPEDLASVADVSVHSAFAFSRQAILAFRENHVDVSEGGSGSRGTLLFTGATASLRGNTWTSAFSAGKHATRALSQSLAKEFGKENIHVAHVIVDGGILTDFLVARQEEGEARDNFVNNPDARLDPESIAKSYLYLVGQNRSAWTWELDLRPAHEKW